MHAQAGVFGALVLAVIALLCVQAMPTSTPTTHDKSSNVPVSDEWSLRIFNGYTNTEGYPWLGMLFYIVPNQTRVQLCAATIISNSWAMTAGHCPYNISASSLSVWYGQTNLLTELLKIQEVGVSEVFVHPSYSEDTSLSATPGMDVALLHLAEPVNVTAIGLNTGTRLETPGTPLTVAGWGHVGYDHINGVAVDAYDLQEAKVEPLTELECFRRIPPLKAGYMCAGTVLGDKDACIGDSGGPLQHTEGADGCQVGIVSHGYGDTCDTLYSYRRATNYQKVSSIYSWAQQHVNDVRACS